MIEFANSLDRFLQFPIIAQPATDLGNPFAPYAELPRPLPRIGNRQHENMVAFSACRTVRPNSEPRSNSPLIGNLLTSFWRVRRVCSRIIHKNDSEATAKVS